MDINAMTWPAKSIGKDAIKSNSSNDWFDLD